MKALYGVLLALSLSACSTLAPKGLPPSQSLSTVKARAADAPVVAVALSGGGSKAAPFALGVLESLVASGDLAEVDTISSVSGGGYAALFLYARANDIFSESALAPPTLEAAFADCLPRRYVAAPDLQTHLPPVGAMPVCPASINNYVESTANVPGADPFRFQNHLRGFQSLLRKEFIYTPTSVNRGGLNAAMLKHVGASLVTAVPHHFANTLFDWKVRISPTGKSYDQGIHRTWGRTSAACADEKCPRKAVGEIDPAQGMTFKELRGVIAKSGDADCNARHPDKGVCGLPDWYINATVARSPLYQFFAETPYDFDHVFHFSASGYGSESLGIRAWSTNDDDPMEPRATVPQAVASSAAFLDVMPSNSFPVWLRLTAAGGQHLFNLSWGHLYKNYNLDKKTFDRRDVIHRFLPFPLYFLPPSWYSYGKKGSYLRLSDGGRAENMGAYSALRSSATDLILVDAAQDRSADFADLCDLRKGVRALSRLRDRDGHDMLIGGRRMVDIELDGLKFDEDAPPITLAGWCDRKERPRQVPESELIYRWPAPVLVGCVLNRSADGRTCASHRDENNVVVNVYLLKPVIPARAMDRLRRWQEANPNSRNCFSRDQRERAVAGDCQALLRQLYEKEMSGLLPPEVVGYWLINSNPTAKPFPQHSTFRATAHSSPFIFGAYRALARHLADHLDLDKGRPGEPVKRLDSPRPHEGAAAPPLPDE